MAWPPSNRILGRGLRSSSQKAKPQSLLRKSPSRKFWHLQFYFAPICCPRRHQPRRSPLTWLDAVAIRSEFEFHFNHLEVGQGDFLSETGEPFIHHAGQNEIGASTPCNASNQRCHHFSRL